MKRRASLLGEMGAGALAGVAGAALALSVAVTADWAQLSVPGAFAGLLERLGSGVHGAASAVLPAAAPVRAMGLGLFAAFAVVIGAVLGAVLRDIRAGASVGFWMSLAGIALGVGSAVALPQLVPGTLTEIGPVVVLLFWASFALGLMLLSYFRQALEIAYEPRLGQAELPVVEVPETAWFHQTAPLHTPDAWAR